MSLTLEILSAGEQGEQEKATAGMTAGEDRITNTKEKVFAVSLFVHRQEQHFYLVSAEFTATFVRKNKWK